ncbi:MAG: flagellar hook-associated protein FlgK [Lachnospiraceae bacterium]|nr:flagellar hook-associated protein FlgK [Lachnospiraceae bacterium]
MGSLYVGSSGLQTSQNALNTTAHNLTNTETTGYVRQQVQQSTRSYLKLSVDVKSVNNKQVGLGVTYSRVKHIRDYFLDKIYRRESGRSMFYEVSTEVMEEVEGQLGEMHGEAFQTSIEDFWTAVQELAKDPASSVTQGLLVQRGAELIQRAQAVYAGLSAYQDNLNMQVKDQVDKINSYGKKILELNEAIRKIESGGVEQANDLRDTRDQLLDELSEMVNINYGEAVNGDVWVQIEGVDFVKGPRCFEIGLDVDDMTGFYTPFWPENATYKEVNGVKEYDISNAKVFKFNREISTDLNTDIGGLKATLLARGDHRADYRDVDENVYNDSENFVSQSVIMNVQAEFDQLIHNIATKINEILGTAAGVSESKGTFVFTDENNNPVTMTDVKICKAESEGYMRNDDGSPIEMFARRSGNGYQKMKATADVVDADGNVLVKAGEECWVQIPEDPKNPSSLYTITNLQIEPELMQKPSMLGFRLPDGSEDQATADALKAAFTEEKYTLNPNISKRSTFISYYTDLVSQIANTGYVSRSIYLNQQDTMESINSAREQVSGVSSDEELSNMIKFQNAYNASSRYINVIDQMLEHLLSTLGV